jgi:C4-dicarboxylate-specific signal transduction histidine kinase
MPGVVTVLWLVDEQPGLLRDDERVRHIAGDPDRPGAAITSLLAEGGVLAVVRDEAEAERAIAYGADEAILVGEASGATLEKVIDRTTARARARFNRDLYLIDLVRKDDTSALSLLAAALGREIIEPLALAARQSSELVEQLEGRDESVENAHAIADTVSRVAKVVEQMRQLVGTEPTDEIVDLSEVTRDVTRSLQQAVLPVASFHVEITNDPCCVGIPRWQAASVVASLVANSVDSVSKCDSRRTVSVRVAREGGAAILEVTDDGAGMDDESRIRAADPFYTTSEKGQLGLGLPLVVARVRRAGGDVILESDAGVGTTVRVFLPLVGGEPEPSSPPN